jgi:hypothetical protein
MPRSIPPVFAFLSLALLAVHASADPTASLDSLKDLATVKVGDIVPINVNITGLSVGSDFIFVLNTHVLFDSSLFKVVPDPSNSSGLTPGTIFFDSSQVANFNAASSYNSTSVTGNFSDSSPNSSFAINQNGLYYTFDLQAIAPGSGSISFDSANNTYAADDTGFNLAPLPTGGPLSVTISPASVPEASTLALLGAGCAMGAGFLRKRRSRITH